MSTASIVLTAGCNKRTIKYTSARIKKNVYIKGDGANEATSALSVDQLFRRDAETNE